MSNRFFVSSFTESTVTIDGAEAKHIQRVIRLGIGDRITLFDGTGAEFPGEIVQATSKDITVEILERLEIDREVPGEIVLASALPKGDRQKTLIEKLTEVGVHRFIPLSTEYSVVSPGKQHQEKFVRYVIEASKQCQRNRLMEIDAPQRFEEFVSSFKDHRKVLLHPGKREVSPAGLVGANDKVLFGIGPEGGFSDSEVRLAEEHDFSLISLGKRILRIETAAIAVAAVAVARLESQTWNTDSRTERKKL